MCEINTMLQQNKLTALVEFEFRIYQITEYMIKYVHCIHIGTLENKRMGKRIIFPRNGKNLTLQEKLLFLSSLVIFPKINVLQEMFLIVI